MIPPTFDSELPKPALVPSSYAPWMLSWLSCPVATRCMMRFPAEAVELSSKSFSHAYLYRDHQGGGAVILPMHDGRVMSLDYSTDAELMQEWRGTLRSYTTINRLHFGGEGVKLEVKQSVQLTA